MKNKKNQKKKYALVVDGVVKQVQPYPQEGFIECDVKVKPHQLQKSNGKFENPPPRVRDYTELRVSGDPQYAPIGEQLDALWKFVNQQRLDGVALPQDTDDALNHVLNVKKQHPKPKK